MPTLSLVKFSRFEPVMLTVPYLSINYSQIAPFFADPITIDGIKGVPKIVKIKSGILENVSSSIVDSSLKSVQCDTSLHFI